MSEVHEAPKGAQGTDPSAVRPALNWQDREEVRRWFETLRAAILDGLAAGQDLAKKRKQRFFSRHEARRRIVEAEQSALALLDAGERGFLPAPAAKPSEP